MRDRSTPGRCWPGPDDRSDLLLSLADHPGDHPQIAPESTINLFDGTENDEILTLRTLVLTDAEKAEARATDPRAAEIIDAVDALPPEILERLHGAIRSLRGPTGKTDDGIPTFVTPTGSDSPETAPPESTPWWDPAADASVDPETDSVLVGGRRRWPGAARSCCAPGAATDAQDRFLAGMRATVQAVVHDVDGEVHVAVSVDDDPAAELQLAHGRFRYFRPDELEPVRRERPGAGRRDRQRVPLRRRVRRRGRAAPAAPRRAAGATSRSSTSGSAACTWPTSCSTATRACCSSTRCTATGRPARCTCWSTTYDGPPQRAGIQRSTGTA